MPHWRLVLLFWGFVLPRESGYALHGVFFVPIDFRIADSTGDPVTLEASFRLGPGDTAKPMTLRGVTQFPHPNATQFSTSQAGEQHSIIWDSAADLVARASSDLYIEIIPHDAVEPESFSRFEDGPFTVDNNSDPQVTVKELVVSADRAFEIPVRFVLEDRDGQGEGTLVILQWSLENDFPDLGQIPLSSVENPTAQDRAFLEDLLRSQESDQGELFDLRSRLHILRTAEVTLNGFIDDCREELPPSRITVTDFVRKGLWYQPPAVNGSRGLTEPPFFLVGQSLRLLEDESGLDVVTRIVSFDPGTSIVTVESVGDRPLPASWPQRTRYQLRLSGGLTGLTRSPAGVVHSFLWDSFDDLLGSGHDVSSTVVIRATAFDSQRGEFYVSTGFTLENDTLTEIQTLSRGVGYVSLAAGDFNGDGRKEIAGGNENTNSVDIFRFRASTYGFSEDPDQALPVGGRPAVIGAGDVTGDSADDLLVGVRSSGLAFNSLLVFDGTELASPSPQADAIPLSSAKPVALAVGDVDGDGLKDAVLAVGIGGARDRLMLFLQKGRELSRFPDRVIDVDDDIRALALGQLNGDGLSDIVTASWRLGGPTGRVGGVAVFFQSQNSRGAVPEFSREDLASDDNPHSLAVADINDDGHDDVVAVNRFSDVVEIFFQENGTLSASPGQRLVTDATPSGVLVGDFGGSGGNDLVVLNKDSSNLQVFLHKNAALSETPTRVAAQEGPRAAVASDFNLDGKDDVAVVNGVGWGLSLFVQSHPGFIFSEPTRTLDAGPASAPIPVRIGDVTGDGRNDLVVLSESNWLVVYAQDALGNLPERPSRTYRAGTVCRARDFCGALALGDVDGDGLNDAVVANRGDDRAMVFHQDGFGGLQDPIELLTGEAPSDVEVGDLNADGRNDIAVANSGSDTVGVFFQKEDGTLDDAWELPSQGSSPTAVAIGDLDGDSRKDLVTANNRSNSALILYQDEPFRPMVLAVPNAPRDVVIGDFNGDGRNDVAFFDSGGTAHVFLQRQDGTLPAEADRLLSSSSLYLSISAGDINGDGVEDVLLGSRIFAAIEVYMEGRGVPHEEGANLFRAHRWLRVDTPVSSIAVGDVNGDGRNDIAATSRENDVIHVFLAR